MASRSPLFSIALLASLLAPRSASALEQPKHRALSRDGCAAAGLPWNFCLRVGSEAYNVDAYEWSELPAHAQIDVEKGQSACDAANLAAERVRAIGEALRSGAQAMAAGDGWANGAWMATQLGRALHTVQDNCAHRGVSNPHHAWFSLSDTCSGTHLSPDTRPDAIDCAARETADLIDAFAVAVSDAGLDFAALDDGVIEGATHWPDRGAVCEFLASANSWNGVDDHWESGVMVPALRDHFAAGIFGASASRDVCGGDPNAIASASPDPRVDTGNGQSRCFKVKAYCLGKADAPPEAPPWEDAEQAAIDNVGVPPAEGCAVAPGRPHAAWSLPLVVIAALRRRRATRSTAPEFDVEKVSP